MGITLTLLIQILVFAILVWVTMKFIWPPIMRAMDERSRKIATGLAAAEKGQQDLAEARERAEAIVREARERANQIVDQAQHRANDLVQQARDTAGAEGERLVAAAHQQIERETTHARESLRKEIAQLAVAAASRLLEREIDATTHGALIDKLATQI